MVERAPDPAVEAMVQVADRDLDAAVVEGGLAGAVEEESVAELDQTVEGD